LETLRLPVDEKDLLVNDFQLISEEVENVPHTVVAISDERTVSTQSDISMGFVVLDINIFKQNDAMLHYYTGRNNYSLFLTVLSTLNRDEIEYHRKILCQNHYIIANL